MEVSLISFLTLVLLSLRDNIIITITYLCIFPSKFVLQVIQAVLLHVLKHLYRLYILSYSENCSLLNL
jgi:hypothetical protein